MKRLCIKKKKKSCQRFEKAYVNEQSKTVGQVFFVKLFME